jgi:hypothetical protein
VSLSPLDKYNRFQPTKQRSIFLIMPSQIDFALNEAPNGRPRYFMGREDALQPLILANPPTSSMAATGTNSDLVKLISTPRQLQSIRKGNTNDKDILGLPREKSKYHLQIIDLTLGAHYYSWILLKKIDNSPLSTVADNILLNASITTTESKRDNRFPYLKPQKLVKKPKRVMF